MCVCESDLEQVSALKPRAQCFRRVKVLKPRVQDHMENHSVCVCVFRELGRSEVKTDIH